MVTMSYLVFVFFLISVSVALFHLYAVKTEKSRDFTHSLKEWVGITDAVSNVMLVFWLVGFIYCSVYDIAWTSGVVNYLMNLLIAISIIQRNSDNKFWKASGYFFVVLAILCILSGCQSTKKFEDPVQPAGAIIVKVPVPTCDDNLAKSLLVVSDRPKVLPINQLTAADKENYDVVYKAYIETVQILTEYAVSLERDRSVSQMQCKAIRQQVDTLNTKTPVIPVQK